MKKNYESPFVMSYELMDSVMLLVVSSSDPTEKYVEDSGWNVGGAS